MTNLICKDTKYFLILSRHFERNEVKSGNPL